IVWFLCRGPRCGKSGDRAIFRESVDADFRAWHNRQLSIESLRQDMSNSLQDQLLKAGLVDKQKAKALRKEKNKGQKKLPKGTEEVGEKRLAVQQARKEEAEEDRELTRQKNLQAEQKAILAQIQQLIQARRINIHKPELVYQFTDGKQIKKLLVNSLL